MRAIVPRLSSSKNTLHLKQSPQIKTNQLTLLVSTLSEEFQIASSKKYQKIADRIHKLFEKYVPGKWFRRGNG